MSPTDTTIKTKHHTRSVAWYTGHTDRAFETVAPGAVVGLKTDEYDGRNTGRCVRILTETISRVIWHGKIDQSIFWRPEWLEFQIAFGELVYNHAQPAFPNRAQPVWKVYPSFLDDDSLPAQPVALIWRVEQDPYKLSTATMWWGDAGQDLDEFRTQVLATLPEPLSRNERFALRDNAPVNVLVAAEASAERNELIRQLTSSRGRIRTIMADTAAEVMARIGDVEAVIVADQLRGEQGGKLEPTYSFGIIPEQLRPLRPCIGFPVESRRAWKDGRDQHGGYGFVMMHLQANCGYVIGGKPEPTRHIIDLVLDAIGLPKTKSPDPA